MTCSDRFQTAPHNSELEFQPASGGMRKGNFTHFLIFPIFSLGEFVNYPVCKLRIVEAISPAHIPSHIFSFSVRPSRLGQLTRYVFGGPRQERASQFRSGNARWVRLPSKNRDQQLRRANLKYTLAVQSNPWYHFICPSAPI